MCRLSLTRSNMFWIWGKRYFWYKIHHYLIFFIPTFFCTILFNRPCWPLYVEALLRINPCLRCCLIWSFVKSFIALGLRFFLCVNQWGKCQSECSHTRIKEVHCSADFPHILMSLWTLYVRQTHTSLTLFLKQVPEQQIS